MRLLFVLLVDYTLAFRPMFPKFGVNIRYAFQYNAVLYEFKHKVE